MTYEQIKKMPLNELMQYKATLEGICEYYDKELVPYFGTSTMVNNLNPYQKQILSKLEKAKGYLKIILSVIEENVYEELDNWQLKETKVSKVKSSNVKKTNKKG